MTTLLGDALLYAPIGALISVACFNCIGAFIDSDQAITFFQTRLTLAARIVGVSVDEHLAIYRPKTFEFPD